METGHLRCASVGKVVDVASVGGVGCVLIEWVALVILEEIPGWWARQYHEWRIISQTFSKNSQTMNIVQSWKNNSRFRSCIHFEHLIFQSFPWIFEFKIVSRTNSELWHIQNLKYIKNLVNITCGNLAYSDS